MTLKEVRIRIKMDIDLNPDEPNAAIVPIIDKIIDAIDDEPDRDISISWGIAGDSTSTRWSR